MWKASLEHYAYTPAPLAIGALAVMRRRYTVNGALTDIPGHVGVVSNFEKGVVIVHANPRSGIVEKAVIANQDDIMGYISPVIAHLLV